MKCSCNKTQRSAYISSSAKLKSTVLFFSGSGIKVVFSSGSKTHEIYSNWKSRKHGLESQTVDRCTACTSLVLFCLWLQNPKKQRGPRSEKNMFSTYIKSPKCVRLYWECWPEFNKDKDSSCWHALKSLQEWWDWKITWMSQEVGKWLASWWLNQPSWKICSSKWIISPGRVEN